jgi:hypothetical protein
LSRPRSGRAASGGGRPAARPGVFVQAPKSDIYVTLLGVALGAMILGCLLLVLILNRYEFKTSVSLRTPLPSIGRSLALGGDVAGKNSDCTLVN